MNKMELLSAMHKNLFIGIVRDKTVEESIAHAKAYIKAGVISLEISSAGADPVRVISTLKEEYGDDVQVGAGTVLDDVTARIMMLAGADYIAAPTFNYQVYQMCNKYGVFYMPTCFTSNEIANAMKLGISVIKLFPGEVYGPKTANVLKRMYQGLEVIAAGGADYDNLEEWLEMGVWAIGVTLPSNDLEAVTAESKKLVEKMLDWGKKTKAEKEIAL